ncbi:MAG: copper oxidase [Pirellulales bacterium]|nr:copper oxidase [Pirellulales bacterium]
MDKQPNRRAFLAGGSLAAGSLIVGSSPAIAAAQQTEHHDHASPPKQDHAAHAVEQYPRHHAGPGGPVGSPTDRGKLVAGLRSAGDPPVEVETPDVPKLAYKTMDGIKEFHLHAQVVQRELLPGEVMNHWGYNGSMPGPTIEVNEGDRVRFVLHNELPEPTTLHLHGIELPNYLDGVEFVTQDPIMPGQTGVYELTLHQNGTFFYHPHMAMQEAIGMVGLLIIHPRAAYEPVVDQDFALISQEFSIPAAVQTPASAKMPADFNWFTFNGRSAPYITPLVVRLGNRVRIRLLNFSTEDHHPIHLHGHTFWVTGNEGGRIPDTAWVPGNNVLVAVAQVREIEFIANNPGDWVMHCHMFHHMMNHMEPGIGPGSREKVMMGQTTSHGNHAGHGRAAAPMTKQDEMEMDPYQVPGYPQDSGMHRMMSQEETVQVVSNPLTRGMGPQWYMGVMGLMTVVRVLPPDLYDKVVSGKGEILPGASVPNNKLMPAGHMGH